MFPLLQQESHMGHDEVLGEGDEYGYTDEFVREKYHHLTGQGQVDYFKFANKNKFISSRDYKIS